MQATSNGCQTLRHALMLRGPARTLIKARSDVNHDKGLYRFHALLAAALVRLTSYKCSDSRTPSFMAATHILCAPWYERRDPREKKGKRHTCPVHLRITTLTGMHTKAAERRWLTAACPGLLVRL